jgi:FADH2 O2-dependent halogenase
MRPLTEQESAALTSDILETIKPFNVMGLDRRERRNWYPVDADDLMNASSKLGASRDEVLELLQRCGFHRELNSVDA